MHLVYTYEEPPQSYSKSIFLAGPTPRSNDTKSWRSEAIELLRASNYDGVIFIPEERNGDFGKFDANYDYQKAPAWEHEMLDKADCILFWVPRDLETLPGFTTNVEFGLWARSGKVVIGAPTTAEKMRYLWFVADKFNMPQSYSLEGTIEKAITMVSAGAIRRGGERDIPLHIWNTRSFQEWYMSQKAAGNRIDGAKVEWSFRVGKRKDIVFYWALHVNVYVAKENRNKINEVVISRFDISSVLLYLFSPDFLSTKIVTVREFRSPARTDDGFIHELPGGSSADPVNPTETIGQEVEEEVGMKIADMERLKIGPALQLAGTMSSHKSTLFHYQLSYDEYLWLKNQEGIPHGADLDNPTGERTYIEIKTLRELLNEGLIDWSTLGMISYVMLPKIEETILKRSNHHTTRA